MEATKGAVSINFYDTNALLLLLDAAFNEPFLCSDITLHELEAIKTSKEKSPEIKYKARRVGKLLDQNVGKYGIVMYQSGWCNSYPETNDNKIVACALDAYTRLKSEDILVIFVSNDICCKNIARQFGLPVESVPSTPEQIYEGYKTIRGNAEEINQAMEQMDYSQWNANEYLLIENTEDETTKEMRWDGEKFVSLKLPPSKFIKAKNSLQRCALDLLMNPSISIVAILGSYGSGKTMLSMQMALYHVVEKGNQSKILGVREAWGEGREIGWLKGDFEDKTEKFFLPLAQQLNGGEYELEGLKQRGILESNIPYYLKGTTYHDTVILVDEAEDLTEKQIKLIGTRLGENSRIFWAGDYKQSVINATENNALVKMCNELKGNPSFGCICLGEDVRSETSKLFAGLFTERTR